MGSEVSSCCGGGGGEAETQLHIPSPPEEGQVKYGETASEFTKEEVSFVRLSIVSINLSSLSERSIHAAVL